ncbi:MAG: electron transfer flavoprotein subunit alpha/FixB family protein [Syntrophorhabdales bacterium]|jgi:electron transfer flavoprotein alpha subunit
MSREERDVIVFLETSGETRGDINRGLLTEGRRIADLLGGGLSAMVLGGPPEELPMIGEFGASPIYQVEGSGLSDYRGDVYAHAAKDALARLPFRLLLLADSDRGRELGPRIAAHLGNAAVTACVGIDVRDGRLVYVHPLFGGWLEQEVLFSQPFHEVATIRPDALDKKEMAGRTPAEVIVLQVETPPGLPGLTPLGIIPPDYRTADILDARRVIGVGSGCADPKLLDLVEELTHLLEGALGTTRPVVDDGYLPKERMIGQTGKTILPELYLALGISGSPHHVAGIQQAGTVLSVNRDQRAAIFNVSDVGFVGDLQAVLPKLIDRMKRYRDEGHL